MPKRYLVEVSRLGPSTVDREYYDTFGDAIAHIKKVSPLSDKVVGFYELIASDTRQTMWSWAFSDAASNTIHLLAAFCTLSFAAMVVLLNWFLLHVHPYGYAFFLVYPSVALCIVYSSFKRAQARAASAVLFRGLDDD